MRIEIRITAKLYDRVSEEEARKHAMRWYNVVCNGGTIGPTKEATIEIRKIPDIPPWEKIK